jgi:hypothetical protein
MRVDSYAVKGNATLFDGSVVETGQATADLRLEKGTEITLSSGSRGTLYRDHLVLQQGASELAANSTFQLQANGLRVTANEPNSRGVVSLKAGNMVEVATLSGSFGVTNSNGVLLASVRPGHALSFAMQAPTASGKSTTFTGTGMVTEESGQYFLTIETGEKYKITCGDLTKYVGKKVQVTGTVQAGAPTVVCASSIAINGAVAGISATTGWIIAGAAVAGGTALGVGIYQATKPGSPASR